MYTSHKIQEVLQLHDCLLAPATAGLGLVYVSKGGAVCSLRYIEAPIEAPMIRPPCCYHISAGFLADLKNKRRKNWFTLFYEKKIRSAVQHISLRSFRPYLGDGDILLEHIGGIHVKVFMPFRRLAYSPLAPAVNHFVKFWRMSGGNAIPFGNKRGEQSITKVCFHEILLL